MIAGFSTAWIAALMLELWWIDGFEIGGILVLLGLIVSLCVLGVGIVLSLIRARHSALRTGLIWSFFFLSLLVASGVVVRWQIDRSTSQNLGLVTAIENYRSINNRYPIQLSDLIPNQIDRIPTINLGLRVRDYSYSCDGDGASYSLSFPTVGLSSMQYSPRRQAWRKDD